MKHLIDAMLQIAHNTHPNVRMTNPTQSELRADRLNKRNQHKQQNEQQQVVEDLKAVQAERDALKEAVRGHREREAGLMKEIVSLQHLHYDTFYNL